MQKRLISKAFIIITCFSLLLIGCKEAEGTTPEATSSEMVSEAESEVISEEVSKDVSEEVVSEEAKEEVNEMPEIVDGVQMVYYETYEDMSKELETLEKPAVVAYSFYTPEKGQAIMYDGAYYTIEQDFATIVRCPNTIKKVNSTEEYVHILDYDYEGTHEWAITIYTTGTDIEVPLTITYEDGTEESLTVYITKDWNYSWGE